LQAKIEKLEASESKLRAELDTAEKPKRAPRKAAPKKAPAKAAAAKSEK